MTLSSRLFSKQLPLSYLFNFLFRLCMCVCVGGGDEGGKIVLWDHLSNWWIMSACKANLNKWGKLNENWLSENN